MAHQQCCLKRTNCEKYNPCFKKITLNFGEMHVTVNLPFYSILRRQPCGSKHVHCCVTAATIRPQNAHLSKLKPCTHSGVILSSSLPLAAPFRPVSMDSTTLSTLCECSQTMFVSFLHPADCTRHAVLEFRPCCARVRTSFLSKAGKYLVCIYHI